MGENKNSKNSCILVEYSAIFRQKQIGFKMNNDVFQIRIYDQTSMLKLIVVVVQYVLCCRANVLGYLNLC